MSIFDNYEALDKYLMDQVAKKVREEGLTYRQAMLNVAAESPALVKLREVLYMEREGLGDSNEDVPCATAKRTSDVQIDKIDKELKALVKGALARNPQLSYGQATKLVASEHRDLICQRETLIRLRDGTK